MLSLYLLLMRNPTVVLSLTIATTSSTTATTLPVAIKRVFRLTLTVLVITKDSTARDQP